LLFIAARWLFILAFGYLLLHAGYLSLCAAIYCCTLHASVIYRCTLVIYFSVRLFIAARWLFISAFGYLLLHAGYLSQRTEHLGYK
jgi:hypothetical protein